MKTRSFTKTIIKSTFLTSLITNILTIAVLFIVCSNLISNVYTSRYNNARDFISNIINKAINTDEIFVTLDKIDEDQIKNELLEIDSIMEVKESEFIGLSIFFIEKDVDIKTKLSPDLYKVYYPYIGNNNVKHQVINFEGALFIVDIKEFGEYIYLQFFNTSKSEITSHLNHIESLLGFYYNNEYIPIQNDSNNQIRYSVTIPTFVEIPGFELLFTNGRQTADNIILFLTILGLSIFRFAVTVLNARRNVRKITKPLDDLVNNTEKLAAHELSEKLNRFDYPFYEFKQLAEAFNKVLLSRELSEIKLFRSFEQMESVVHKRTQELISTNEQLTQAIKKTEEANDLKSQFLANISHEIRTPLNCIMGFCDIILTEEHSEQVTIQIQQILHESETLLHLINDFLDYSKIDAGKMNIVYSELNIRSLINSLMKSGQVQVGDKNINLYSDIDDSVPLILMSDELRLYQIVSNIFYNAIKFTPTGSVRIKINSRAMEVDSELLLMFTIIDTGIGIPVNRINSIFNKFEQVDGSLTRKYRGSGLGLTICKKIIELMKGTIEVTSEMNKGSCFKFSIPVKTEQVSDSNSKLLPAPEDDVKHTKGSHILLVEDYPVNRIVAKKHLEMDKHYVTVAENGQEALGKCKETQFDLILMDLQMPVMDGFQATKHIRGSVGLNRKTPILAMTANAMDTAKQTCLDTGMDGIITKPIRKKMFLIEVDKWLKISSR